MGSNPVAIWSPLGRLDPLFDNEDATLIPVNLQGDSATVPLIMPPGLILAEVTATPGLYGVYDSANSDGTQYPRVINQYLCYVTGAAGAVGSISSYGAEWPGQTWNSMPAYKSGDFDLSKLYGLDSNAIGIMYGRIIEGALGVAEVDSFASTASGGTLGLTIPSFTLGGVTYPATVVSNTTIGYSASAANVVTYLNSALVANGVPAWVTATGGALGSAPVVITFHGLLAGMSFVMTVDNTNATGGTGSITRSTHGVAAYGVVRFG